MVTRNALSTSARTSAVPLEPPGERVHERDRHAEGERLPEVRAVGPDRLADELSDRPLGRRQRRRQLARRSRLPCGRHAGEKATSPPRRAGAEARRRAPPAPAGISQRARSGSPISFETARSSTAGTPASAQARRTPNPSIASTSIACGSEPQGPPTAALVPIGSGRASGKLREQRGEQRGVGLRAGDHGDLGAQVAVDGFRPEDERARRDAPAAGDADVEHRIGTLDRECTRGRGSCLYGPDPANEPRMPAELGLGRGDEQDALRSTHPAILRRSRGRALVRRDEPEHRVTRRLGEPLVPPTTRGRRRRRAASRGRARSSGGGPAPRRRARAPRRTGARSACRAGARPSRPPARSSPSCGRRTGRRASARRRCGRSRRASTRGGRSSAPEP